MKPDLFVNIEFNIKTNKAKFDTNIKKDKLSDIIATFLQGQMGAGSDPSKAIERDVYKIRLELDLSDDTFSSSSNCGNKGLRDGILYACVAQLEKDK
jgi:hypothetical protein